MPGRRGRSNPTLTATFERLGAARARLAARDDAILRTQIAVAQIPAPAPPRFSQTDQTSTTTAESDEPQIADNTWHNAVACTDSDNPRDPWAVGRYARLAEPAAPVFA